MVWYARGRGSRDRPFWALLKFIALLINNIKKYINNDNDLSVYILSLISMQNKNWIELHPEHLNLILEAINLYDNGTLKKQIIIEILQELEIF